MYCVVNPNYNLKKIYFLNDVISNDLDVSVVSLQYITWIFKKNSNNVTFAII